MTISVQEIKNLVSEKVVGYNSEKGVVQRAGNGRLECPVCDNDYVKLGSLINHVVNSKETYHISFVEDVVEDEEKEKAEKAEASTLHMVTYYSRILFLKTRASLDEMILKKKEDVDKFSNDFSYQLQWAGEDIIMAEERIERTREMVHLIESAESLKDMLVSLEGWSQELVECVLDRFPHHNSTSEFSNIVDRLKAQSRAEFIRSRFRLTGLGSIIRIVKDLIKEVEKIEV